MLRAFKYLSVITDYIRILVVHFRSKCLELPCQVLAARPMDFCIRDTRAESHLPFDCNGKRYRLEMPVPERGNPAFPARFRSILVLAASVMKMKSETITAPKQSIMMIDLFM